MTWMFCAVVALGAPLRASAQQLSYFLQISGIDGESTDDRHANWIDLSSMSFSLASQRPSDFHFTTGVSSATPALLLAAASGQSIPNAVVAVRRGVPNNPDFLTYTLADVVVTSQGNDGSSTGSRQGESFALSYSRLQISYRPQRPDGSYGPPVTSCWDFVAGAPCS